MICSVSIESPIESLKVSPTILIHQVVEYRIHDLTEGTFTLLKPTIYPDPHDLLVRRAVVATKSRGLSKGVLIKNSEG